MPIIYDPQELQNEIENKKCTIKPPYNNEDDWDYSAVYHKYRSRAKDGTIWLCPGCGTYLHTYNNFWHWTKWYHFGTRRRIRAYERGLDTGGTVL